MRWAPFPYGGTPAPFRRYFTLARGWPTVPSPRIAPVSRWVALNPVLRPDGCPPQVPRAVPKSGIAERLVAMVHPLHSTVRGAVRQYEMVLIGAFGGVHGHLDE